MSGGKGGSQSTQVQIPQYLEDPLKRQIQRAEIAQQMQYTPYMGPQIAGFNQPQRDIMSARAQRAQALGIVPQGYDAMAAIPQRGMMDMGGGRTAYASYPGAREEVLRTFEEFPRTQELMGQLYSGTPAEQQNMAMQNLMQMLESGQIATMPMRGNSGMGNGDGLEGGALENRPTYDVPVSGFLTDVGFGLYDAPLSPFANLAGGAILDAQIEARAKEFEDLPTTTGGGMSSGQKAAMSGWSE